MIFNKITDILGKGTVGFTMNETMSGEHQFEKSYNIDGKHPFEFNLTWGPTDLLEWGNPHSDNFLVQPAKGYVTVGGIGSNIPCEGTFELKYFKDNKIIYNFDFEKDGVKYNYVGEKVNIKLWNLATSHTTCFGVLTEKETGKLVSKSITYFKLKTTFDFIKSFRII